VTRTIVVGTRQSRLAVTQTEHVVRRLEEISRDHGLGMRFEIRTIVTRGDQILDVTLSKVGGKGLFVKEIEQALLDGGIDLAVHSMKDVPSELPDALTIGAVPRRADPRDCLVSRDGRTLDELPKRARIGTSSLRRTAQLRALRPDLVVESVRGNIDTRLRKLETEGFDAIVLAAAGLARVGWEDRITEKLSVEAMVPAAAQGALGVECRKNDDAVLELLSYLRDPETETAVRAERAFLARLNGGCQVPIGAHAVLVGEGDRRSVELVGFVGSPDGSMLLKERQRGEHPETVGRELAETLLGLGADRILQEAGE